MFEHFTERARSTISLAKEEARLLDHNYIGTEHILLGLLGEGEGVAAKALDASGISLPVARETVTRLVGPSPSPATSPPPFTPRAKKIMELSLREARRMGRTDIGTGHLLLGIVIEGEGMAAQVLVTLGTSPSQVRQQVLELLSDTGGE